VRHDLVLEGSGVRLEPLAESHLSSLRACANDPLLWQFVFQPNPFTNDADAHLWYTAAVETSGTQTFVIVDKRRNLVAGSTRYLDIDATNRKREIGFTFLSRRFWRTHVNAETKLLLLEHAFEHCGDVRVQFKAEAINERSHRALLRIGATHEGTLRNFRRRPDGELRDVSFYSIVPSEWPAVKARLLAMLTAG
jgi:RimJ/RimL family protein N-acetyltransferase